MAGYWEDLAQALHFESSVILITDMFYQTEDACQELGPAEVVGGTGGNPPASELGLLSIV